MSKALEMEQEADAILQALEKMKTSRELKSSAGYLEKRLTSAANRLADGARISRERERSGRGAS